MLKTLYDCKVRLGGSLLNEVPRFDVTAAEILLLRSLHKSDDSVVGIVAKSKVERTDREERARLANLYSPDAFTFDGETSASGIQLINSLFGVAGVPLPQALDTDEVEEDEPVVDPLISRGPRGRPPKVDALIG